MAATTSAGGVPPPAPELTRLSGPRLLLCAVLEPVIRAAGWCAGGLGRERDGVEQVLRGYALGGRQGWRIGREVRFIGPAARFRLGPSVTLYGNACLNAGGPQGGIEIGAHSHVDQFCVLYGQGGLAIGAECAIASGVIIYSQTNQDAGGGLVPVTRQPTRYARVQIGDGCWLGAGARVVPGVTIGAGAHIGAGAVVLADVEPAVIAVGVPARTVKRRT